MECAAWLDVPFYALQRHVPTRWWSDVTTPRSLLRNRRAIPAKAMKKEAPVPESIEKSVLLVIEPFVVDTETMESGKYPTAGFVLGMACLLRKQIDKLTNPNTAIRAAALDMSIYFRPQVVCAHICLGAQCTVSLAHLVHTFRFQAGTRARCFPSDS